MYQRLRRHRMLVILFMCSMLSLTGVYMSEMIGSPDGTHVFAHRWDVIRWGVITATTIGYGDVIPQTMRGQFFAIFFIVITIGLLSEAVRFFSKVLYTSQLHMTKGLTKTTFTNHIVIYGGIANYIADMIDYLAQQHKDPHFVVIHNSDTLPTPLLQRQQNGIQLHFVTGTPEDSSVLDRANIIQAASCVLLHEAKSNSDMFLLSYIMMIRHLNPTIHITAELHQEARRAMLLRAGCNSVINTHNLTQQLLKKGITDEVHHMLHEILRDDGAYELYRVPLREKRYGETLGELIHSYVDNDIHIIGIYEGGAIIMQPNHILTKQSMIYVISATKHEAL